MTAGAIAVPTIVPLRAPVIGQSKATIDTSTKLELRSETPGASIFYTLNGEKPSPFESFGPAAKATLAYRDPFTLPGGKHTIKAIAVLGDGRESYVVTKKFEVEQLECDLNLHGTNDVEFINSIAVTDQTKKEVHQFTRTLSSGRDAWTAVHGTTKYHSSADSAREDLAMGAKKLFGPRFMNSRLGNTSERAVNGHGGHMTNGHVSSDVSQRYKLPPDDAAQVLRLQRETDFLKCVYCFAPRPTDPFVRFCNECGHPIPPLPQTRIPPPEAGQVGTCVSCKATVPLNAPNCLVCEAPLHPQNVPQASLRLADKLLCIVCGTANPPNLSSCVMCASNLLTDGKLARPNSDAPPPSTVRGATKQFMQCAKCGRTNSPEARFCDWCGSKPLSVTATMLVCSKCKGSNNPYAQFCGSCGVALTPPLRTDLVQNGAAVGMITSLNSKTGQWMPLSSNAMQLRTDASTQTVGLFFPSQREMDKQNEELDRKLNVIKQMRERRPVMLTAVSPGKGYWRKQMEHITEHLKAHAANDPDFRALIGEPRMGKLLSAAVHEDGYELCLSVNFALRGGSGDELVYGGLPTGSAREPRGTFKAGRRSSLTRYASQDSLESMDNMTARSRTSRRSSARRSKKVTGKKITDELMEEDKKLLREIGKNGEGSPDTVQRLVDEGANPSCINKDGLPALHVAVLAGHADVIPVLVQAGANVNKKGPSLGNTALHEAISLGISGGPVIDALLGCNANVNMKNDKGDTPHDLAVRNGHDAIAKMLTSFMGQSTLDKFSKSRGLSVGLQDTWQG